jgi:hypothetical protein
MIHRAFKEAQRLRLDAESKEIAAVEAPRCYGWVDSRRVTRWMGSLPGLKRETRGTHGFGLGYEITQHRRKKVKRAAIMNAGR